MFFFVIEKMCQFFKLREFSEASLKLRKYFSIIILWKTRKELKKLRIISSKIRLQLRLKIFYRVAQDVATIEPLKTLDIKNRSGLMHVFEFKALYKF